MKRRFFFWAGLLIIILTSLTVTCVNLDEITVTSPDLGSITDGTYQGSAKVGPVRVTLDVAVQDFTITSIQIIRHFNGKGKKAEAIVPKIIESQSLDVDVISGATGSSKAILLAVQNALNKR
jgi:uncharacterized protein with FMN-binding domain